MIKIKKIKSESEIKLNNKFYSINVTNACNLACGGCNQLCGLFPKEKIWFISLDQLKNSINGFIEYKKHNWHRSDYKDENKFCGLYGGEPTIHPEFNEILNILYSYEDLPFCIYTNGRTFKREMDLIDITVHTSREISSQTMKLNMNRQSSFKVLHQFHTHEKNVAYRIDFKNKDFRSKFSPTLCAPCDWQDSNKSKAQYVEQAKKVCYQWNNCEHSIYNGKAYACHLAAAMDFMFYESSHGWDLQEGKNPFDKNDQEINKQLENFCYRCGYNLDKGLNGFEDFSGVNQYAHKKTLATKTNLLNSSNIKFLPVIQ
jgi:MoaA/NifB/PqqE/SkfB family radical SAM enzyme